MPLDVCVVMRITPSLPVRLKLMQVFLCVCAIKRWHRPLGPNINMSHVSHFPYPQKTCGGVYGNVELNQRVETVQRRLHPLQFVRESGLLVKQPLYVHAFKDDLVQWIADTGRYLVYVYAINVPPFEGDNHASYCQTAGAIA